MSSKPNIKIRLNSLSTFWGEAQIQVTEVKDQIRDLYPFLEYLFPIVIVEGGQFNLFDIPLSKQRYEFIMQVPAPMQVPEGVRAAFPLDFYDNRPGCVVTGEVFDTLEGYATIFHEFMHCQQWQICEMKLKQGLGIYRKAQAEQNYMWEIEYPFPYQNPDFTEAYQAFLEALEKGERRIVHDCRAGLGKALREGDREYMTWQEWKEGFARFVENLVRGRLGLAENHGGLGRSFSRVTFYEGGARYIKSLIEENPDFSQDIEALY